MDGVCLVLFEFTCSKRGGKNVRKMNNYRAAGCIINGGNINCITCGNEDIDLVLIRQ